jgi:outer membrane protein assembly factor BamA
MLLMPRTTCRAKAAMLAVAMVLATVADARAESPSGKEIAEVVVQGNRLRSTQEILAKVMSRPGQKYSEVTATEDVGRLISQGWFPPSGVQLSTKEREDGKVIVYVSVSELPNTVEEIVYRGAQHLSKDELDKLTGLKRGAPMSPASNQAARQNILRKYQENGRQWASVHLREGGRLEDRRVVFDIAEGPSGKISSIDIEFFGPVSGDISAGRLRTQLQSSRSYLGTLIGGEFNPVLIEMDIVKLSDYYHHLGYLDARVQRELIWSDDHRSVKVIFHIEEGKRYKVGKVQVDGNKTHKEEELLGFTDLREGDYFDHFTAQNDLDRIKKFEGFRGRQVIARAAHHQAGDGVVNVHYEITEREPVRVGDVKIIGNSVTRDNVIRRQVGLFPGQILSFPDLLEAERNLSRLGIFDEDPSQGVRPSVEVENPEVDEPYKNILVRVKEKPTGSFMVGAGVTSDAGVTGSIVVNEKNFDLFRLPHSWDDVWEGRAFRGAGQEFRLEAVPGTQFQRYTASWREPYLFDSQYSLGLSGYYFTRSYLEYNEGRVGGRATIGRRFTNLWSANFTQRVEDVDVSNVAFYAPTAISEYVGHSTVIGSRLGVTRDNRDNYLRPTSGSNFEVAGEWVTGTYDFPLLTGEGTKYWTTWQRKDGSGKHVIAARTQVSYAGSDTPVFERFYAGGFRSLRGFSFRGVGPYENGLNIGGNFAWINSLEYQIPIMANDNLYFVTFVDSGTVEQNVEIKDYRVTAGVGLRIAVPQLLGPVPLALDFGFPINQGPNDSKQIFSFWLGFFN